MKIINIDEIACKASGNEPVEGLYVKSALLTSIFKKNKIPDCFTITDDSFEYSGACWSEDFRFTPPRNKGEIIAKVIGFVKGIYSFLEEAEGEKYKSSSLEKEVKSRKDEILNDIEIFEWSQYLQVHESELDMFDDVLDTYLDNYNDEDDYADSPEWIHLTREYSYYKDEEKDTYNCTFESFYQTSNCDDEYDDMFFPLFCEEFDLDPDDPKSRKIYEEAKAENM